ncbi:DUF3082 domain-containing protein [Prochlorococcus marinus]|uniref:DUF3082 domain-containing protein n=1 Tax=Prochlorococcus marinus TaxID=1219 RepID=UPI0022B3FD36|nr:DUF3082 domain-containing protein [Prochlorococcus marinus]
MSLNDPSQKDINSGSEENLKEVTAENNQQPKKGPLSFLSGALTSILFAWVCLLLSKKVVIYFTLHSPHYSAPIAQSIASAMKTLAIGMCFLATFTFAFIGIGLTIVFIRSLFSVKAALDD